jgi:hypothetical protein
MENNDEWNELVKNVQKLNSMQPLILHEIERLNAKVEDLQKKVNGICVSVAKLDVKAGFWGLVGGAIPVLIILAVKYLR